MPNLQTDNSSRVQVLGAYLQDVLPDSQLTNEEIDSAQQPLLLLQTKTVMAAFGFSNGDMRKSYDVLYQGFKKRYVERRKQWDALDIAFIFCVSPDAPNLDRFCSNVETDVFFCRKFVVPFVMPIGNALARLPFLPMSPIRAQALRPPSAQTFLQQSGVAAVLAKYLVVRGERGPERIVEDCESGSFGEPNALVASQTRTGAYPDQSASPVRLNSVTIKDFRAYRKTQTFRLGTDVTVLYGPNGFGKTSFFDAVDFVITGEIGRLKRNGVTDARFQKLAKHLDADPEDSAITLTFKAAGADRTVRRKVSDPRNAQLDGVTVNRKTVLAELTGGDIPATDRVENFISLFRATHLFSQEHQELADGFQEKCELSAEVVSRLLAFEDYNSAIGKTEKVRDLLKSEMSRIQQTVKTLSEEVADEKTELDRLGNLVKTPASTQDLQAAIDDVLRRLRDSGIAITPGARDAQSVRSWRAAIQVHLTEKRLLAGRLAELAKDAARMPSLRDDVSRLGKQIESKGKSLAQTEANRVAAENELRAVEKATAEYRAKRSEILNLTEILDWALKTAPAFADLVSQEQLIVQDLGLVKAALGEAGEEASRLSSEIAALEDALVGQSESASSRRGLAATLHTLSEAVPSWRSNRTQLLVQNELEANNLNALDQLGQNERELASKVALLKSEAERTGRQIAEVDRNSSEIKKLLSQLQGHARTGTCPLCGEDHGSREELLKRIEAQLSADAATEARASLAIVRSDMDKLTEQAAELGQRREQIEASLISIREAQQKLRLEIRSFEDELAARGFVDDGSGMIEQLINDQHAAIEREAQVDERRAHELRGQLEAARKRLADRRVALDSQKADHDAKEVRLLAVQMQINTIRNDQRLSKVSIEAGLRELAVRGRTARKNLEDLSGELSSRENRVAQLRQMIATSGKEEIALRGELQGLRDQLSSLQKKTTEVTARLEQAHFLPDATEAMVLEEMGGGSRSQAVLAELNDSIAAIEVALDTASTAAAFSRLQQGVLTKEKAIATAKERRDRLEPWSTYFETLGTLIAEQQNKAIDEFTREYGPRTSVIQKRLRSVYGFDEVEIRSHDSSIQVRVKRRGEELRPTDYFSQSQQQTLLLGLFLTACLSQTWSSLSPIFMDDPVTHFDDLNTYAFLDLIVGLVESEPGKRQFVISTCDERFLQLAHQKFRHLGSRSTFYKFSAIGAEGPVVEQINTTQDDVATLSP
jgi:DNA repair protein SbcC/Rad50